MSAWKTRHLSTRTARTNYTPCGTARCVHLAVFALIVVLTLLPTITGRSGVRVATDAVTNCLDDSSAGSLRTVLAGAASGGTLNFALDCTGAEAITLTRNLFIANRDLTIDATAPTHAITLSGNYSTPIPFIDGVLGRQVNVFLHGLTFADGNGRNGGQSTRALVRRFVST